jgi:RecB family endonuclease NucS
LTTLEKAQIIPVKSLPNGSELLIQNLIAEDPSVLKLGKLVLRDKERTQPSGGRLDILLEDTEGQSWYEVEIQLGATDETHIVRTIEYWDRERRRYPDIRHTAVIVAEEINGRFSMLSVFSINRYLLSH